MRGNVAVLMGGRSSEREISLQTGKAICAALRNKSITFKAIDTAADNYVQQLFEGNFSCAFIALHGRGGEDGSIQGFLEMLGIPYTGSGVLGSALSMDKVRSKRIWQNLGLSTPPFCLLDRSKEPESYMQLFGLPLAIKPVCEGSSIGVSRVNCLDEFEAACELASCYGLTMVEPWIEGEEYAVGLLGDQVLPPVQILAQEKFYNYHAKYEDDGTQYICPSPLTDQEVNHVKQMAFEAFKATGAVDWGRVDLIRDLKGDFWILEMNTVPGMTSHSLVPIAAKAVGLTFDDLVMKILALAINKSTKSEKLTREKACR